MSSESGNPAPYGGAESNALYNMLFCDDLALFRPRGAEPRHAWQKALFSRRTDPATIAALAGDDSAESRVRALAYQWLRSHEQPVPPRVLLGVIVEVPFEGGLEVLAAYADGRVRYLNRGGATVIVEDAVGPTRDLVARLIRASEAVVAQTGPWGQERLDPPPAGICRLSFVVSDGLYFGQGQFAAMSQDPMAGPVLDAATRLLQITAEMA